MTEPPSSPDAGEPRFPATSAQEWKLLRTAESARCRAQFQRSAPVPQGPGRNPGPASQFADTHSHPSRDPCHNRLPLTSTSGSSVVEVPLRDGSSGSSPPATCQEHALRSRTSPRLIRKNMSLMVIHPVTGLADPAPTPTVTVKPLKVPISGRGADLEVRVSAPVTGKDLPVVLFAHGFGSSMDGYAPLVDYWSSHGFVVIQPTHVDSKRIALAAEDPRKPRLWRHRVQDMKRILDDLSVLAASVPGLHGRVDHDRIIAAGQPHQNRARRPATAAHRRHRVHGDDHLATRSRHRHRGTRAA